MKDKPNKLEQLTNHIDSMANQPIDQHIQRDANQWRSMLDDNSLANVPTNDKAMAEETNGIVKRLFLGVSDCGVTIASHDDNDGKKQLPLASTFSHGDRVRLTFPNNESLQQFVNWVVTGDKEETAITKKKADLVDSPVFDRKYSTHTITQENGEMVEKKGYGATLASVIKGDKLFGVNLALGGAGSTNDVTNEPIAYDGKNGHLYMNVHFAQNDKEKPVMMVGVENSMPGKQGAYAGEKHGVKGFTNPLSATGGLKYTTLKDVKGAEDYVIPEMGSAVVEVTQSRLNKITQKSADDFSLDKLDQEPKPAIPNINLKSLKNALQTDASASLNAPRQEYEKQHKHETRNVSFNDIPDHIKDDAVKAAQPIASIAQSETKREGEAIAKNNQKIQTNTNRGR